MKEKAVKNSKKPITKKWWFWVILVVVLITIVGGASTNSDSDAEAQGSSDTPKQQTETDQKKTDTEDDIKFNVNDVRNDTTGNWRISVISENIQMQDYALEYYKKYFKSDDEIHAIVNFNYMTTTQIAVMGDSLDVTVHEYVDKEEHDAKLLFSGEILKEYYVNKDTGDIEEIL